QMLLDTTDHLAVDEGAGRSVANRELDAAWLLHHLNVEIGEFLQNLDAVVRMGARIQNRQRAAAKQFMQTGAALVGQQVYFVLGNDVERALGRDPGIDALMCHIVLKTSELTSPYHCRECLITGDRVRIRVSLIKQFS